MKTAKISDMKGGWFIGDFSPTVLQISDCEAAIQHYPKGRQEEYHYHKIATEITVIISGKVVMNGKQFGAGDIILLEPGEGTDFMAVTDVTTAVVKIPSAKNDKFHDRSDKC